MTTTTTTTDRAAILADMTAAADARIADLRRAAGTFRRALVSHGYVVVIVGPTYRTCVSPVFGDASNPNRVTDMAPTTADRATRMTREDAERLAPDVRDGNGATGTAVHVLDAIEDELDEAIRYRASLDTLLASVAA